MPGRREAEEQADEERRASAEGDEAHVERESDRGWQQTLRDQRRRDLKDRRAKRQAQRAADDRQHEALGQQLPDQARPVGTERGPKRQLAAARRRARQEQVGNVGAADEEHERDDAEEEHGGLTQVGANDGGVERLERHAAAIVGLRILSRQRAGHGAQVRVSRRQRHARLQASHRLEDVCAARPRWRTRDRDHRPEIGLANELRGIRHDADHRERFAIETNVVAGDSGPR